MTKTKVEQFDTFGDCIDAWVLEKRAKDALVEREPKFYVSDFGRCHKRMILKRAGVPGRPMSVDSMRNLEERGLLHDARLKQLRNKGALIAADTGTPYVKAAAPTRLSDAFPPGFGCRTDAIGHLTCHCGRHSFPMTVHWGKMARLRHIPGQEHAAEMARRALARHRLENVEVKTAHANLVNYSDKLPRPHNVMQVRASSWAIRKLHKLEAYPYLLYFAVGSGAKAMEFACGGGPDDDYADVEREITSLQQEWETYLRDETLPPCKPLETKDKKEKANRVTFLVADWECNAMYCEYCTVTDRDKDGNHTDGLGCCDPVLPNCVSGDRIGYREEDGSLTHVKTWLEKVPGYSNVGVGQVIEKPRAGE